jgi:hypothetical protein
VTLRERIARSLVPEGENPDRVVYTGRLGTIPAWCIYEIEAARILKVMHEYAAEVRAEIGEAA